MVTVMVGRTSVTGTVSEPEPVAGVSSSSTPATAKASLVESPALPVMVPAKVQVTWSPGCITNSGVTGPELPVHSRSDGVVAGPPSIESVRLWTVTGSVETESLVMVTV